MKKFICLLLALVLVLSMVGCGGDETPDEPDEETPDAGDAPENDNPPDWAGNEQGDGVSTPIIPVN